MKKNAFQNSGRALKIKVVLTGFENKNPGPIGVENRTEGNLGATAAPVRKKQLFPLGCVLALVLTSLVSCITDADKSKKQVLHYQFSEGDVSHFILKNKNGMEVKIMNYGATITHIKVPDWMGISGDVVLGFDSVKDYLTTAHPYFGCVVGRYANRIANGRFVLNEDTIRLTKNSRNNSIHGGIKGFNRKIWDAGACTDTSLVLSYLSKDGEEGFPGNLQVSVTYTLSPANELIIDYLATTDKPTPVNLTNHSYFNLSGGKDSTILNHELYINAHQYTEADESLIPTGRISEVEGGPLDFSCSCRKRIGQDISQIPNGYDHNWILNKSEKRLSLAAVVYDPVSGRGMEVSTTQPGLQFYSGNFLKAAVSGKKGVKYQKHAGLCLETQHFPDSPNHPKFPSTILNPGEKYSETTVYRFFIF